MYHSRTIPATNPRNYSRTVSAIKRAYRRKWAAIKQLEA